MMSPIYSNPARSNPNPNANANLNHLLSFSASQQPNQPNQPNHPNHPQQKGFLQKKVIPVIRRVGAVAGQVSNVAGKVAVVASIL
jgi:hypothetical protein